MFDLISQEINPQIIRMLPEDFIRRHQVIPVNIDKKFVEVAMIHPGDIEILDEIKLITGFEVRSIEVTQLQMEAAIEKYFEVEKLTRQTIVDMRVEGMKASRLKIKPAASAAEEAQMVEQMPVVKLMDSIIKGAINARASDIHLEPQDPEMRVRYRVDGILHEVMTIPRYIESAMISRAKILSGMDITEKRLPQDGHISYQHQGNTYDLRVSSLPDVSGEKMVLRILDQARMLIGLEQMGLSAENENIVKNIIDKPYGMIFVTGPTGSGKTTTLYAVLQRLNKESINIVTIEDPVEFKIGGLNQIQVKSQIGLTFASGLRSILRQDPNVIMVGEVRDMETAEISIQAALTGHLVLSTLHTNDAASAVTRLVDMGVEPFLISSTLVCVVAQRLARMICKECYGAGCDYCYKTGMKGRTGIFEIMLVTENIRRLISERAPADLIKAAALKEGMKTLEDCGAEKVAQGICTREEVNRVVYSK